MAIQLPIWQLPKGAKRACRDELQERVYHFSILFNTPLYLGTRGYKLSLVFFSGVYIFSMDLYFPPFKKFFSPKVINMFAWSAIPTIYFCSICLTLSLVGYLKTRKRRGGGQLAPPPSSKSHV